MDTVLPDAAARDGSRSACRTVVLLTAAFLLRGVFLAFALPFGDPLDEPFHYAYASFLASTGRPPQAQQPSISDEEVRASVVMPQPGAFGPSTLTFRQFLEMPAAEQARRREQAFAISPGARTAWRVPDYESQQPPLAYALAAPLLRRLGPSALDRRLLALRLFGALIAAAAVPIVYALLRRFLETRTALAALAAYVAFPGIGTFVGRFTNDQLALPIAAALLWLLVEIAERGITAAQSVALAGLLAAGLWTKLYFLVFLPAFLLTALLSRPAVRARTLARVGAATLAAALVFVPWAARQKALTGDWFGLTDTVRAQELGVTAADRFRELPGLLHPVNLAVLGRTFVWPGTWTWIGAPFPVSLLLGGAFVFLLASARRPPDRSARRGLVALALALGCFAAGQAAHAAAFAAIARKAHAAAAAGFEGWYALILAPVLLVGGEAIGRLRRTGFVVLAASGLIAEAALLFGLLPACYALDFARHAIPSFSPCLAFLAHPGGALRVLNAVGLARPGRGWLAALAAAWLAAIGAAIALVARRPRAARSEP